MDTIAIISILVIISGWLAFALAKAAQEIRHHRDT